MTARPALRRAPAPNAVLAPMVRAAALTAALAVAPVVPAALAQTFATGPLEGIARVGVARYASRTVCTGFATDTGALITAAHCLPRIPRDRVQVVFGYDRGANTARRAAPASDWIRVPGRDIALLCPGKATTAVGETPRGYPVATAPAHSGDRVLVAGYSRPAEHVLQHNTCTLLGRLAHTDRIVLDCALPRGTSGAPVLRATATGHEIIGLLFASSGGRGLAEAIEPDLPDRLCQP